MTLENITTDRINEIEELLSDSAISIRTIRKQFARGDITIQQAAARINRIGAEIEKAIYPEDQES